MRTFTFLRRLARIGAPLSLGLLAFLVPATQSSAMGLLPDMLRVSVEDGGGGILGPDQLDCVHNGGDLFGCDGEGASISGAGWEFSDWALALDLDPSISANFSFKNVSAITQTFQITFQIPVNISAPASGLGGSIGITVTDANNNGLGGTGTVNPTAFYTGIIDGSLIPAATLFPHASSLNFAFSGQSNVFGSSFGLPGNTTPGPGFNSNIGIFFRFSLSAGDEIGVTALFNVEPVPEPATAMLVAGGLLGLLALRRRALH